MDPIILTLASFGANILLGIATYFMKDAHTGLKKDNETLWKEVNNIKEKYFKKEDFIEFKQELWHRLDDMKNDMKEQIKELRK